MFCLKLSCRQVLRQLCAPRLYDKKVFRVKLLLQPKNRICPMTVQSSARLATETKMNMNSIEILKIWFRTGFEKLTLFCVSFDLSVWINYYFPKMNTAIFYIVITLWFTNEDCQTNGHLKGLCTCPSKNIWVILFSVCTPQVLSVTLEQIALRDQAFYSEHQIEFKFEKEVLCF